MSIGIWQIAIVVILVVLLFGRGKISSLMGDVAKGIKSFKKGMASDVTDDNEPKNISDDNQDSNKKEYLDRAVESLFDLDDDIEVDCFIDLANYIYNKNFNCSKNENFDK